VSATVLAHIGSLSGTWAPGLLGLARVVFGFLLVRHGMEQAFGYPEASGATLTSYEGLVELVSLPGGLLLMLGLFTRPVGLVLAILYGLYWFVGPLHSALTLDHYVFAARGSSDAAILNCFFFLYLSAAGSGAWSLDRRRDPEGQAAADFRWAPYALGVLRIAAGFLFVQHGLEKWFGITGGPGNINLNTLRGVGGFLELTGGPLLMLGLFTRPTAFILSGMMAVAYFTSWAPRGFWASFATPNMEASIQNCFLYLFLCAAGSGAWSLDRARRRRRERAGSSAHTRP
jgi:putative oxidoreductase